MRGLQHVLGGDGEDGGGPAKGSDAETEGTAKQTPRAIPLDSFIRSRGIR